MTPPNRQMRGWAIVRIDGTVFVELGRDCDEATAWQIALGWPSEEEIAWHKARGARAFRCKVVRDEMDP